MATISIRIPEDVIEDLKEIAPEMGFSGYQPLIRAYVGQGLRRDLERLRNPQLEAFSDTWSRHGVDEQVLHEAMEEVRRKSA
jgi:predicted DNA binding CopG/RHH family protein